jgi:hypothetical protein
VRGWYVWGRREMHRALWWENAMERDYMEDRGMDRRIILK